MNKITIHQVPYQPNLNKVQPQKQIETTSFANFLEQLSVEEPLKISKHANDRMNLRDISISDHEWQEITQRVSEAKQKGVNNPLVLLEQAALIVSAKNNTVITALDRNEMKNQLFTNIDGTIVL